MMPAASVVKPYLGRLERVTAREYWESEASDFTPWLAQPDNIVLLGETIRLDLEVETIEKNVGPFRADILCRDTTTNHYVLIENQLERTDHGHLGQLLTYAAGLDAATVVWVASRFTDEHRAALDWLNRITSTDFNFFGLEIELWRIGDSALAPKFNLVSQPNDWSKAIQESAAASTSGDLTPKRQLQLEFWTQFSQYMEPRSPSIRLRRPRPHYEMVVPIGRAGFYIALWMFIDSGDIQVSLQIVGKDAKAYYGLLEARREEIEARLGPLIWVNRPNTRVARLAVTSKSPLSDPASWPEAHQWFAEWVEKFTAHLGPLVRALRPSTECADPLGADADPSEELLDAEADDGE